MTVITVAVTDEGSETVHWQVPPDNQLNFSAIPRGVRQYGGTAAIAALGANDETNVVITLAFPTAFVYLLKNVTIQFLSDDLTSEFSNLGTLQYRPNSGASLGVRKEYELQSGGQGFISGAKSSQVYRPVGTWRTFIAGQDLDTVVLTIADVSNDASTAGDVSWTAEALEYDIEQCLKWPVNTLAPTYSY